MQGRYTVRLGRVPRDAGKALREGAGQGGYMKELVGDGVQG